MDRYEVGPLSACRRLFRPLLAVILIMAGASGSAWAEEGRPRVISLYAAHTEVLLRLGARDNLIGVSGQETYNGPETEGWKRPPVYSIRDDVEKFLAAKPDLVLVRPMHMAAGSRLVETLQSSGVNVYSVQVVRAGDLYKYWRDLAKLVKRESEAEAMIADFDQKISAYHRAASARPDSEKPGVFVEAIHGPIKTFTPDSLPVWLVELGGGRNVAADAKPNAPGLIIADYGPERLLSKAKEVDIYLSQAGPMNRASLKQVQRRPIYKTIKAFKDGRVYKMSEDILARPTPSLLKGLEEIAELTGLKLDGQTAAAPAASGSAEEAVPDSSEPDEEPRVKLPPSE